MFTAASVLCSLFTAASSLAAVFTAHCSLLPVDFVGTLIVHWCQLILANGSLYLWKIPWETRLYFFQVDLSKVFGRKWVDDVESSTCTSCGKGFTLTVRKVTRYSYCNAASISPYCITHFWRQMSKALLYSPMRKAGFSIIITLFHRSLYYSYSWWWEISKSVFFRVISKTWHRFVGRLALDISAPLFPKNYAQKYYNTAFKISL